MHDKLGRLGAQPDGHVWVEDLRGVVLNRGDDAALGLAVAVQVYRARGGRGVFGVDEVVDARVVAPFGIADAVCPGCDAGEVVRFVIAQESLEILGCLRLDKFAGYVRDGNVTETL